MKDKFLKIKGEIFRALEGISSEEKLKELETRFLGRKGELTKLLKGLKEMSADQRKELGRIANETKTEIVARFSELKSALAPDSSEAGEVDVTLPGKKIEAGHLHPITQLQNELEDIFSSMGFMVLDGPELESDYFNFEALNIPKTHPARDMQDTFYVAPGTLRDANERQDDNMDMVMRTHTSPMQIRAMLKYGAPLKCVVPGRVFRNEATDAVHDTTFYQLEGLMVGEDISIANLISVMKEMLKGIFKTDVKLRVRPGYFPFVEPGIEVDMGCTQCGGKGCAACKHSGWLEMVGSGMVHPKVLEYGGVDSEKYSGFAFGVGTTRLAMMKYGIDDIRLFNSGDMRFLSQF